MNNEPVAWIPKDHLKEMGKAGFRYTAVSYQEDKFYDIPLYTQEQLEEARKLGMQQERALWNLSESTQEIMNTHPVKEQGNPVAWRSQSPDGYWSVYQAPVKGAEPLYTGFKELTDFEILQTSECYPDRLHFARAILRKAQEK